MVPLHESGHGVAASDRDRRVVQKKTQITQITLITQSALDWDVGLSTVDIQEPPRGAAARSRQFVLFSVRCDLAVRHTESTARSAKSVRSASAFGGHSEINFGGNSEINFWRKLGNQRDVLELPSADRIRHGVIGSSVISIPSASATAFAIAGAVGMIGGSARPRAPV